MILTLTLHFLTDWFNLIPLLAISLAVIATFAAWYYRKKSLKQNSPEYKAVLKNLRNQEFLVNFSNYLSTVEDHFLYGIQNALKILGKYIKVDRIYIFEDYGSGRMTRNTFEWCHEKVEPEISKYQRIAYKLHLPSWKSQLIKDGVLIADHGAGMPKQLAEILLPRKAQSILVFPMFLNNEFHGFIGFDSSNTAANWKDIEVGFLKTITLILCNAFERRITSQEIKTSEIKFKDLFNLSSDSILIYNLHGDIMEVNQQACEKLEYQRNDLIKLLVTQIFVEPNNIQANLLDTGNQGIHISENTFQTQSGKRFPVEINSRLIKFNNRQAILCVARDVSERKQMQREILSAIIQAEEKERGRIARDLHDGLGPLLSSLKLYTAALGKTSDAGKQKQVLTSTSEVIDESMILIKEISNNLSPHVLNDFGLAAAIQSFCKKITLTKAIEIKFDSNVFEHRFDINTETILFRVLKELVNNTIKHALATTIEIFLLRTENILTLIYSDNGVGFDIKKVLDNRASGMGISNIVNRIGSIHGKLIFESHAGKGIQMKIEVELKN